MSLFDKLLSIAGLSKPKVGPTKKIKVSKPLDQKARIVDKSKKHRDKILKVIKNARVDEYKNGYKTAYIKAVDLCNEVSKRDCYHDSVFTTGSNKIATADLISAMKAAHSLFPNKKLSFIAYPINDYEYGTAEGEEIDPHTTKPWSTKLLGDNNVERFVRANINGITKDDHNALAIWLKYRPEGTYVPFERVYVGVEA